MPPLGQKRLLASSFHQQAADPVGLRAYRRDVCVELLSWSPPSPPLCVFFSSPECRPRYSDVMAQVTDCDFKSESCLPIFLWYFSDNATLRRFSTFWHLAKKHYLLVGQGFSKSLRFSSPPHLIWLQISGAASWRSSYCTFGG